MTIPRPDHYSILEIVGKVKICCPAGASLMTPYILQEQQDWFEDEIKFLREIVRPDTNFIDIGANYGLYSLSVANLCRDGHVWCYEPCKDTAGYLGESIAVNQFRNITLINKALSNAPGVGRLRTGDNSELNALTSIDDASRGEEVELTTLEAEHARHDWKNVDIVKIDAEGHELQVLEGGIRFFTTASPLVMCEIKAAMNIDFTPVNFLVSHGYRAYRVIPGLQALAPMDLNAPMDGFQLNTFCCKPDRAAELQSRNRLVMSPASAAMPLPVAPAAWAEFLRGFPYGAALVDRWLEKSREHPGEKWPDYEQALNLYALARSTGQDITTRYNALYACYRQLQTLVEQQASLPRLLSFARVALDYGMRENAIQALGFFLRSLEGRIPADLTSGEPFLSPSSEYEQLPPVHALHNWAITSALDAYERFRSYSSYFTPPHLTVQIADEIKRLGYSTPGMERRADLARGRLKPGA